MPFFKLHEEKKIGYKCLTDADLGRSPTSHQTHIGLFEDVFTYLPNNIEIEDAMLIYNDNVEKLPVCFDRIQNPDGSFRSPKIRSGERGTESVVSFIRETAKMDSKNNDWYLFWFGLQSGQPVFFLFEKNSKAYMDVISIGLDLEKIEKGCLDKSSRTFDKLLGYLEDIVNKAGVGIAEFLELSIQTDFEIPAGFRTYDFETARLVFQKTGRTGEELVNEYFCERRRKNEINDYRWLNEHGESRLPYDFCYKSNNGNIVYLDVKTTNYKFTQKMIFSIKEVEFASTTHTGIEYHIYRVYKDDSDDYYLRICKNSKDMMNYIYHKYQVYASELDSYARLESVKFAIMPNQKDLSFDKEKILLGR